MATSRSTTQRFTTPTSTAGRLARCGRSTCRSKRKAARLEPAIFAIGSADAVLEFVRLPGVDGVLPGGRHPRQIGGMHGVRRPPLPQLFKRPAEVIEDLAVDVLNAAVGRHDGDEAGKGLDDEAEALFAGGRSLSGCVRISHILGLCHRSGASSVASPSEAQRRPKCTPSRSLVTPLATVRAVQLVADSHATTYSGTGFAVRRGDNHDHSRWSKSRA